MVVIHNTTKHHVVKPKQAMDLQVGEVLVNGTVSRPSSTVISIQTVKQRLGLYAPLTENGFIVVSGVLTSNYVA